MSNLERVQRRVFSAVTTLQSRVSSWAHERERGDVPGWVMITVMTAGLVVVLTLLARPLLGDLFTTSVNSVVNP